jgi:hypothetical protein
MLMFSLILKCDERSLMGLSTVSEITGKFPPNTEFVAKQTMV